MSAKNYTLWLETKNEKLSGIIVSKALGEYHDLTFTCGNCLRTFNQAISSLMQADDKNDRIKAKDDQYVRIEGTDVRVALKQSDGLFNTATALRLACLGIEIYNYRTLGRWITNDEGVEFTLDEKLRYFVNGESVSGYLYPKVLPLAEQERH